MWISSPAPAGRPLRRTRRLGAFLAVLSVLGIAALTLSPQPPPTEPTFGHWCLVCGRMGVADAVANVLLFVPLGVALVLAGLSWRQAALAGLALTVSIELAQLTVVPGRFATIGDVATNTTGATLAALLVAHRRAWLRPAPRVAGWLAAIGALLFVGALALGGYALGARGDAPGPWAPSKDPVPVLTGGGWYAGAVHRVTLDGFTLSHRGSGPVTIAAPARHALRAEVVASGWDARPYPVAIVYVHRPGENDVPWLVVGQHGRHVILEPGLRARALRLRRPTIGVRRSGRVAPGSDGRFTASADVSGDRVTLTVRQDGVARTTTVRLSPTLGWALLSPGPTIHSPRAPLASAAWLAGLALPLGYWLRWMARGRRGAGIAAAAATGATLAVGLVLVPTAAGFLPARPWEWIAAIGGVAAGAAAAEIVRRIA